MFRKTKDLEKFELRAGDGTIGHVEDFYFDDSRWLLRYFVVNAGSWLNGRRVLISPVAVGKPEWKKKLLPVALTKDQVRHSPGIDTDKPVSRQHEAELTQYYGWPYYWGAGGIDPAAVPVGSPPDARPPTHAVHPEMAESEGTTIVAEEGDPHLHSARVVRGYRIKATDGEIGHVEDFLLDDQSWIVSHLIIDTRHWWPGKKVIISPQWITRVNWADSEVAVDLSRESIKLSPEYNPSQALTVRYVDELHDYYGRPRFDRGTR